MCFDKPGAAGAPTGHGTGGPPGESAGWRLSRRGRQRLSGGDGRRRSGARGVCTTSCLLPRAHGQAGCGTDGGDRATTEHFDRL